MFVSTLNNGYGVHLAKYKRIYRYSCNLQLMGYDAYIANQQKDSKDIPFAYL